MTPDDRSFPLTSNMAASGSRSVRLPRVIIEILQALQKAEGCIIVKQQDFNRWRAVMTLEALGVVEVEWLVAPNPPSRPEWEAWRRVKLVGCKSLNSTHYLL